VTIAAFQAIPSRDPGHKLETLVLPGISLTYQLMPTNL